MTDKRKQRVRRRMAETGMTYQAITNLAVRAQGEEEHLEYCPSCDGRYFEFKHTAASITTYDHKPGCLVGEMRLVPDSSDETCCARCGHREPIIRKPPYGLSLTLHCPKCFKRVRDSFVYVAVIYSASLVHATAEDLEARVRGELAKYMGWKPQGAAGTAYVQHFDDDTDYALEGFNAETLLTKGGYDLLFAQAAAHPHENAARSLRLELFVQVPVMTVREMQRQ